MWNVHKISPLHNFSCVLHNSCSLYSVRLALLCAFQFFSSTTPSLITKVIASWDVRTEIFTKPQECDVKWKFLQSFRNEIVGCSFQFPWIFHFKVLRTHRKNLWYWSTFSLQPSSWTMKGYETNGKIRRRRPKRHNFPMTF